MSVYFLMQFDSNQHNNILTNYNTKPKPQLGCLL